jgi:DNA repair protein RecO (recombination protein O)
MLYDSKAFSLTYLKYNESAIISKLFTQERGLQTFIINSVRKKKSNKKLSFFKPLQLLNISAVHSSRRSLQYMKDLSLCDINYNTNNSMHNQFVALFISEVLAKTLKENQQETAIFNYLLKIKSELNNKLNSNYSISFLIRLTSFFGFYPSSENENGCFFDLERGEFLEKKTSSTINKVQSMSLRSLISTPNIPFSYETRKELLNVILEYYKHQNHEIKNLNSHLIIESLRI